SATLAGQFTRGSRFDADYMGSIQPLANGNELVGWGSEPYFSEYDSNGRLLLDAVLPRPDLSYRASLGQWVGLPLYPPSAAVRTRSGRTTVYASWNGATEVSAWRVLGGSSSTGLRAVATAKKSGFETPIAVPAGTNTFKVQ